MNKNIIYSLPDISKVDSSSDFFNEDGSKSVRSELLVDTKEVDFSHLDLLSAGNGMDGDTSDETNNLLALLNSDTF